MRHRIYSPVITALAILAVFAVGSAAAAPTLSKPAARKAAVAKMNRFLASHSWADAGKVGRCQRKAPRRVLCQIRLSGSERTCRAKVTAWRASAETHSRLSRLTCMKALVPRTRFVRLAAHLGEPRRDTGDPYAVTYPYTASAEAVEGAVAGLEATAPPEGVLAFYSDGILECALNVGGVVVGDECRVDYEKLGQHRVTSIYTSGSESAAATELQDIQPLATSVELAVEYQEFPESELYGTFWWQIGSLVIDASASPGDGQVEVCLETGCLVASPGQSLEVPVLGVQCGATSERNAEPLCQIGIDGQWYPLEAAVTGFAVTAKRQEGGGYLGSETSVQASFVPELHFPACDEESSASWC